MSKLNKSILSDFESAQITRELPKFSQGDTVVVNVKVKEGNRERVQAYEGVVIGTKNAGLNSAFTVRKISHGYGVERVFQTHRHHRLGRSEASWQGPRRQAVLPAWPGRQGCPHQGRSGCCCAGQGRAPGCQGCPVIPGRQLRLSPQTATFGWPFAFVAS